MKHDSSPLVNSLETLLCKLVCTYLEEITNKHRSIVISTEIGMLCVALGKLGDDLTETLSISNVYFMKPYHEYATIIHHVTCQTDLTHYISLSGIYPLQQSCRGNGLEKTINILPEL